ncbi:MAG: metal-dependent hydrolase [Calditrichaceae bacterium]
MFIGHFGAGLAAKKLDNRPSLATFFMAAQFIDLIWPIFLLFGIERVEIDPGNTAFTPLNFVYYPFTHSFLGVLFWAVLFGGVYYIIKKNQKSALILGGLVMSHWALDLLVHRPDLPLFPWTDLKVGLGLWQSVLLTIVVEGLIFSAGVYFYLKTTKAENKKGVIGFWSLIVFLVLVYFMNVFGPPPETAEPIAVLGLSQWILVAWTYWIDKNRKVIN